MGEATINKKIDWTLIYFRLDFIEIYWKNTGNFEEISWNFQTSHLLPLWLTLFSNPESVVLLEFSAASLHEMKDVTNDTAVKVLYRQWWCDLWFSPHSSKKLVTISPMGATFGNVRDRVSICRSSEIRTFSFLFPSQKFQNWVGPSKIWSTNSWLLI